MKNTPNLKNHKIKQTWIGGLLALAFILTLVSLLTQSPVGMASVIEIFADEELMALKEIQTPPDVVEDAAHLAERFFKESEEKYNSLVDKLLVSYSTLTNKDFLILFNPGGWGVKSPDGQSGWGSILAGIQSQICAADQAALVMTYQRTVASIHGYYNELKAITRGYGERAIAMAAGIQFLTEHNLDLTVLITGESLGTLFSAEVMQILAQNPRVFSIQTGPPAWQKPDLSGKTLQITHNGNAPDAFSRGDIMSILKSNLPKLWDKNNEDINSGQIFIQIEAPGHEYSWQSPGIAEQINQFMVETVGLRNQNCLPIE